MRGEHVDIERLSRGNPGIIPACAGSTVSWSLHTSHIQGSSPHARGARGTCSIRPVCLRDHPRMRGEHLHVRPALHVAQGIIPACAGSTSFVETVTPAPAGSSPHARGAPTARQTRPPPPWDHPRMRGEHAVRLGLVARDRGIIPACAGSTHPCPNCMTHPPGSSPHARGARRGHASGIQR